MDKILSFKTILISSMGGGARYEYVCNKKTAYRLAGTLDARYPPGIWVTIYPQKNELSTIPIVSGVHRN
jgi:hypothetical protein